MNILIVLCLVLMLCCLVVLRRAERAEEDVRQLKTDIAMLKADARGELQ